MLCSGYTVKYGPKSSSTGQVGRRREVREESVTMMVLVVVIPEFNCRPISILPVISKIFDRLYMKTLFLIIYYLGINLALDSFIPQLLPS